MVKEFKRNSELIEKIPGYNYIASSARSAVILPVLVNLLWCVCFYEFTAVRNEFFYGALIPLIVWVVHMIVTWVVRAISKKEIHVIASILFIATYLYLAFDSINNCMSKISTSYFSFYEGSKQIKILANIFIFLLIAIIIIEIGTFFKFRKYELMKQNLNNCCLKIHEDGISGITYTILEDRNTVNRFEFKFDEIQNVFCEDLNFKSEQLFNLIIRCSCGEDIKLSINNPIAAREELKYIINEIEHGYRPYPRRVCSKCGWFMKGDNCPNCDRADNPTNT